MFLTYSRMRGIPSTLHQVRSCPVHLLQQSNPLHSPQHCPQLVAMMIQTLNMMGMDWRIAPGSKGWVTKDVYCLEFQIPAKWHVGHALNLLLLQRHVMTIQTLHIRGKQRKIASGSQSKEIEDVLCLAFQIIVKKPAEDVDQYRWDNWSFSGNFKTEYAFHCKLMVFKAEVFCSLFLTYLDHTTCQKEVILCDKYVYQTYRRNFQVT